LYLLVLPCISTHPRCLSPHRLIYALHEAPLQSTHHRLLLVQLLINGKFEDAMSGKTFYTYDPRTGEPLVSVAEAQAEDVDRAVRAAREVCQCRYQTSVTVFSGAGSCS
jgi:hypothetical protein